MPDSAPKKSGRADRRQARPKKTAPARVVRAPEAAAIPARTADGPAPLTPGQEELWLLSRLAPDARIWNQVVTIGCPPGARVAALERAFNELLRRHQAWRSVIRVDEGRLVQAVLPPQTHALPLVDLGLLSPAEREAEARRLAAADAREPFDLEQGPLWRVRLIAGGEAGHRLQLTLHQLVFDGASLDRVLLPELASLHDAFARGEPSPLAELPVQYPDFADWQRAWMEGAEARAQLDYWKRKLERLPGLPLPIDRERPRARSFRAALIPISLPERLLADLRALSRREDVTLFEILLAAFSALLQRYSGQDEVVVGTLRSERKRPELEGLLGYFLNPVVLRTDLSGDPTFNGLLQRVREVTLAAFAHDDLPFEQVAREHSFRRDPGRNPLFQVAFSLEPTSADRAPGWSLARTETDTVTSAFDLHLELEERPDGLDGRFVYSTDLFDAETVGRMAEHWKTLLEAAAAQPGHRLSELPLLTQGESGRLDAWNATGSPIPEVPVHRLFEEQAERTPAGLALRFDHQGLAYRDLDQRANQLANHLRSLGVGPGALVGICVERGLDMVVSVLAVLKAGGAYVPLDAAQPIARLAFVLEESECQVLVTESGLAEWLPSGGARIVRLDTDGGRIAALPETAVESAVRPDHPACVIYTAEPADRPNGVRIRHRALVNLLGSFPASPGPGDVLVAVTTLASELASLEVLLPLVTGACLAVAGREVAADGRLLAGLLATTGATFMQATPATWQLLVDSGWAGSPRLTAVSSGGALTPALATQLLRRCQEVWNVYGTTETAAWSAGGLVEPEEPLGIGRPLPNTTMHVLDPHGNRVPIGVPGQLFIGGAGVADGYVERPELTAERFVPDRFGDGDGWLYGTGERVRFLPDGQLQHLGNPDQQPNGTHLRRQGGGMTPVETAVAEAWSQALGVAEVSAEDDFFALGGNPLLAVRVMAELEARFHRGLGLAAIFHEGSTVEGLARLIAWPALAADAPASDLVILMRVAGSRPPLFLVEPDRAGIMAVRGWLPALGNQQPVAGMVPRTDPDDRFGAEASVEGLASELVDVMRENQPQGPYRLAGHGFGGLLAYEMACQLHAASQEVAFLGLIETVHPQAAIAEARDRARASERLKQLLLAPSRRWSAATVEQDAPEAGVDSPVFDAAGALRLTAGYPVTRFPGPVVLFSSEAAGDPWLGWSGRHPGPLWAHALLGDHRSMFAKSAALAVAEELDRHLDL